MEKSKRRKIVIAALLIYVSIGICGYFVIKNIYRPFVGDHGNFIYNAIDVSDVNDLIKMKDNNESSYVLIYGEFASVDSIYYKFLNDTFSYVDELKIDNRNKKEVRENSIEKSEIYSINGVTINGLNFDIIEPKKMRTITDIRNRKVSYEYYVKRDKYIGTMLCYINKGKIEPINFYDGTTISSVRMQVDTDPKFTENTFIILWALFLILLLISMDNLDENPDDFKVNVRER